MPALTGRRYALGNVRVPENGARPIREMPGTVRVQVRFPMEMAHEVERKVAAMTKTAEKIKRPSGLERQGGGAH